MRVRVLTTAQELTDLPGWEEAVRASGSASPFLSREWMTTWWECAGAGRALRVLAAEDASGLQGLAPFMITTYRRAGVGVRVLEFVSAPFRGRCLGTRLDLAIAGEEERCLDAFGETLLALAGEWDFFSLRAVPAQSHLVPRLCGLRQPRLRCRVAGVHTVCSVRTEGLTWEAYLRAQTKHFRQWLRSTQKCLPRDAVSGPTWLGTPQEVTAGLPALARVCARSWKQKEAKGLFGGSDATGRFFAAYLPRASAQGTLRLSTLALREEVIAYQFSLLDEAALWFYDTAYQEEHAASSPGANLVADMIRLGFETGAPRVDLGPGLHPYKLRWENSRESRVHWLGFHQGARSRLAQGLVAGASLLRGRRRAGGEARPGEGA